MSEHIDTPAYPKETTADELSLKDLILKLKEYYAEVLRGWPILFLLIALSAAAAVFISLRTPSQYPARLTFMLNEDSGNSLGGFGSILGQFGIGGGRGGKYNPEKILELAKSRYIIQSSLLQKVPVDNNTDYLANHLIREYELHEKWKEDTTDLKNYLFKTDQISTNDRTANQAMSAVYNKIVGGTNTKGILNTAISDDTGIMALETSSTSEALSISLTNIIYETLSAFYVKKTTEKQQQTYTVVKAKTDSILAQLSSTEYELAKFEDNNRNLWSKQSKLKQRRLNRDVQMLTIMYGEALKNLEFADFSLKDKTPFVQVIDRPIAPIRPDQPSLLKNLILGILIGGMLGVSFLLFRKIMRDSLKEA